MRGVGLPVELQDVVAGQVGLVAERHEGRQADPLVGGQVERDDAERGALGGEGDPAGGRRLGRGGDVERDRGDRRWSTPISGPTNRMPASRQIAQQLGARGAGGRRVAADAAREHERSAATSARAHARATRVSSSAGTATTASSVPAGGWASAATWWTAPLKPAAARLRRAAWPDGVSGPITASDAGRRTCPTAATAARRARSRKRRRPSSSSAVGNVTSISPSTERTSTGKPELRKTLTILWLPDITAAVKVVIPSAAATSASWASSSGTSVAGALVGDGEGDLGPVAVAVGDVLRDADQGGRALPRPRSPPARRPRSTRPSAAPPCARRCLR